MWFLLSSFILVVQVYGKLRIVPSDSPKQVIQDLAGVQGYSDCSNENSEKTLGKISFDIPMVSGWNDVSVPVILTQTHPDSVFPGNVGVYTWDGSMYIVPSDIKIGWGYWVCYAYDTTITVTGPPVITYTRPLPFYYNIIGSTIDTVPVSDIVMFPDSCASFYCDTIFPGKFCWAGGPCDSIIVGQMGIEEAIEFQVLNPNYMYIYPNPFIHFTAISYRLPVKSKVSLRIYDVAGRIIKTLVNKERERGNYNVSFDARGLRSGIYFARLVAGAHISTQKLILLK